MHPKKQLTRAEFNAIKPYFSKRANVEALYAVMVAGRSQSDVAREAGVTRKAISQGVGKAWSFHIEHGSRPSGWVSVNVALPPDLAEIVKDMARNAREKLGKKNATHENDSNS